MDCQWQHLVMDIIMTGKVRVELFAVPTPILITIPQAQQMVQNTVPTGHWVQSLAVPGNEKLWIPIFRTSKNKQRRECEIDIVWVYSCIILYTKIINKINTHSTIHYVSVLLTTDINWILHSIAVFYIFV